MGPEEFFEEPVEEEVNQAPMGFVYNCEELQIMSLPDAQSEIVLTLISGDLVQIFDDESTENWYKVFTSFGIDGFCKKEFISR